MSDFAPGLRFSALDGAALGCATALALGVAALSPVLAMLIAFVTAHFFLFCNVFRISRASELVWAALFTTLAMGTIAIGAPGWPGTMAVCLATTWAVVALEMRSPSYHGVFWRRVNPDLPSWWAREHGADPRR